MPPTDRIIMLSNHELANKLRQLGVTVGPIVQSTRGLYENKLRKLESGEVRHPKYEEVPDDEDDEDEEDEDEDDEEEEEIELLWHRMCNYKSGAPVQVGFSKTVASEARHRVPTKATPPRVKRDRHTEVKRESMFPASHQHASTPDRKEEGKKGFPVWTLLFVCLIVTVLGYMIVKNMEADAENSIPNQLDVQV